MLVGIMWKHTLLLVCLSSCCLAGPLHGIKRNVNIVLREADAEAERPSPEPIAPEYPDMPSTLTLPSNATSIRHDITDNFSCEDKVYGYYADVENECQIFHVCLPVTYADGKENTFRWSFICPEETVFSQDSFTCLRREDMAITCEDSVNYYELNRNFGMTEEQSPNSNSVRPSDELAQTPQTAAAEPTLEEVQQSVEPQEELLTAPAATVPQSKPAKEKPVKVQKPNRRKPQPQPKPQQYQTIYPTNKLPLTMPLRKMPNVGPKVPVSVPVSVPAEVVAVQEVEAEAKPVPPRYKKRPALTNNSEKEFVEAPAPPFKVDMVHTLSNPESFKRKRPTFAHTPNMVAMQVPENLPVDESVPEVLAEETAVTAVKFESNLGAVPLPAKDITVTINEPIAEAAETTPVIVEPLKAAVDAEPQASETEELVVEPENTLKTTLLQQTIPEKETAPVVAEETEYVVPAVEEAIKNEEPVAVIVDEVPKSVETIVAETVQTVEAQNEKENATPIEAIEEIPAVVSESFDTSPEEEKRAEATIKKISIETPIHTEQPAETDDQLPNSSEPIALDATPEEIAIIENAAEALPALPVLEELEEQKPADAIEIMPATLEMEQQDPVVQAFAEKDNHMQTVGGFKPVDPEMAAEAEALISDFINTLKSGNPNMQPNLPAPVEQSPIEESQKAEVHNKVTESEPTDTQVAQESDKTAIKSVAVIEPVAVAAENTPIVMETEPIVAETEPIVTETEPNIEEEEVKVSPMLKFPISNSFPADMYHIPVTVIQTPYEELPNFPADEQESQQSNVEYVKADNAQVEEVASAVEQKKEDVKFLPADTETETTAEQKVDYVPDLVAQPAVVAANEGQRDIEVPAVAENVDTQPEIAQPDAVESEAEAAQPSSPMAYRPISIDDIVELVKQRLDQVPANEKGAPMELVMEPGSADKPVELKFSMEKGPAPQEVSAEQTPTEDIIFPIYHRLSGTESNELKSQEILAVEEPNEFVHNVPETEVQTVNQAVQTSAEDAEANAVNKVMNIETETKAENLSGSMASDAPAATETAEVAKANRTVRARSLTKAKLDPRKRRFLFRADAS